MSDSRRLLPTASSREAFGALCGLARPRWLLALAAIGTLVAGVVVSLTGPPLLGRIVDIVVDGGDESEITTIAGVLLLVALGQAVLTATGSILLARLGEGMLADLRETVVDRALNLPVSVVEEAGSGDIAARVGGDVATMASTIRYILPEFLVAALNVGLTIAGLAWLDWRFALAGLCAAPIQVLSLAVFVRRSAPIYSAQRVAQSGRAQAILDAVEGAQTARLLNLGPEQVTRVRTRSHDAVDLALRAIRIQTTFSSRLNAAEFVGLAAVLVTGFFLVRDGAVTIGATTAATLYFHRLFDPIGTLLHSVDEVLDAASGLARLVGISRNDAPAAAERVPAEASAQLRGVDFAYVSGHDVLKDIDIEVSPGERVALVGASGAGKTTIARLVAGYYEPTRGEVRIGGVEAASAREAGKPAVVLVAQEVHVFAGTIAEDLRLAAPAAGDETLWAALEAVQAAGWVRKLPLGIETVVGAGGQRITPAQAQQLALARLVLVDPPIAVLDEATAEAGSAGARVLESSARAALEGRTGVIVAHRLTQAASANRIVVVEQGRVVESGTHAELLSLEGAYASLWSAWSANRRMSTEPGQAAGGGWGA